MGWESLVVVHVCCAMVGIISGFLAMVLRKGTDRHRHAGNAFVLSMMGMSTSAIILAGFIRPNPSNVLGGLLMFYLVTTAWLAGRRREMKTGPYDIGAFLLIGVVGAGDLILGSWAVSRHLRAFRGVPVMVYFVFGTIALLFAVSDGRMLARGGVTGARRIARHLWRMCLALLMATMSFYPGNARLFPKELRATNLLNVPAVLLAGSTLLWLVRVSRGKRAQREAPAPALVERKAAA